MGPARSSRDTLRRAGGQTQEQRGSSADPKAGETLSADHPRPSVTTVALISLGLALATLAVYARAYHYGFIAYDDNTYVYDNPIVKKGLTPAGIAWAFTTFDSANWHPLTWLSHMVDCSFFGVSPGPQHVVNLAFHLANVVLLFFAFVWMTRRPWRSAIVAGIFALHPLHVESVAWIAERKDVLSTFLGLVTVLLYARYAARPSAWRYSGVAGAYALALLAKPMLVTLPFVLLLLDIWPLSRLAWPPRWRALRPRVVEKLPLLAMVAAACVLTLVAQKRGGAVATLSNLPFSARLANASIGYVTYIERAFAPVNLAVLYPVRPFAAGAAVGCALALAAATAAAVAFGRKRPYCLVGWFWYLGMLVPVIGLVQVGAQSTADRYTYLPLVGLSIALVWPAADVLERRRTLRAAAFAAACAATLALGAQAYRQTGYWESGKRLFEHTLAVTEGNSIIHNNLGVTLLEEKRYEEAAAHYGQALAIRPDYPEAHANLGHELLGLGRLNEAAPHLARALEALPGRADVQADMGLLLAAQGRLDEARVHLETSLRIKPDQPTVHSNLGFVLLGLGRADEAILHCGEALRLDPRLADAHYNMGMALAAQGKKPEAVAEFSRVLTLSPGHAGARAALEKFGASR